MQKLRLLQYYNSVSKFFHRIILLQEKTTILNRLVYQI